MKHKSLWLLAGAVGVVLAIWYFFFRGGAALGSLGSSSAAADPGNAANVAVINAWIGTMSPGSAQEVFWQGTLASASASTISQWVACLNGFAAGSGGLSDEQQSFWDALSQGH